MALISLCHLFRQLIFMFSRPFLHVTLFKNDSDQSSVTLGNCYFWTLVTAELNMEEALHKPTQTQFIVGDKTFSFLN